MILTEAEHKEFTVKLAAEARKIEEMKPMKLWKMYQKVYKDHPAWLEAIKPYFFKGK